MKEGRFQEIREAPLGGFAIPPHPRGRGRGRGKGSVVGWGEKGWGGPGLLPPLSHTLARDQGWNQTCVLLVGAGQALALGLICEYG